MSKMLYTNNYSNVCNNYVSNNYNNVNVTMHEVHDYNLLFRCESVSLDSLYFNLF